MRKRGAIVLLLVGLALTPAAAGASAYSQVLRAYQTTGSIPACQFSSPQLVAALKGIDTYGQQYFADFSDAVQGALAARAAGACSHRAHPAAGSVAAPQAPLPPSVTAATSATPPTPLLALAGLSLALVLIAAAVGAMRVAGSEPAWATAWRHACGEAEYRIRGGLADLADRRRRR